MAAVAIARTSRIQRSRATRISRASSTHCSLMAQRESWPRRGEERVQGAVDEVAQYPVESTKTREVGISRSSERVSRERSRRSRSGAAWELAAWLGITGCSGSSAIDSARLRCGEQAVQL